MNHMKLVATIAFACAGAVNAYATLKQPSDYDVGDYVQSGLVAQYDGIRNEGANLPHNPSLGKWQDLKSGNYMSFCGTSDVAIATGRWTGGNSYEFNYSYAKMAGTIYLGTNITVEVALDADFDAQSAAYAETGNWRCQQPQYVGVSDNGVFWVKNNPRTTLRWKNTSFCGKVVDFSGWNGKYLTLITTYDYSYLTQSTSYENETDRSGKVAPFDRQNWTLGGMHSTTLSLIDARLTLSRYYAARFYNRPLTEAELAQNRKVDEIRFRGAIYTNVLVAASSYPGVSGVEPAGVYDVDGSHVFSAPNVTVGNMTYVADGYTIEVWNGSAWGGSKVFSGNSYTYTVSAGSPIVRLTWLWKPVRGIRTAADYDACDYVQGGLVAQYDGVRNAGAGLAHDPLATTWKDLKSDNYMTFNGTTDVAVTTGSWAGGNAYRFVGDSYAYMADAISLGTNITVQLAMDIDNDAQIAVAQSGTTPTYASAFYANNHWGFFTRPYLNLVWQRYEVIWRNDAFTGATSDYYAENHRSRFSNWTCRYITGIATEEKTYAFQGVKYTSEMETGSEYTRAKFLPFDDVRWSVGGRHSTTASDMELGLVRGLYYSARFYNRALTEDELAWNRKVDEVRFHGVVHTNVVVASSKPLAQGVQPNGVYEVLTDWTFTAEPVPAEKGGAAFTYVPDGYTIERWTNGAWGAAEPHDGTSYTYDVETESGTPVRLTWKWRAEGLGMMLIYR